MDIEKTAYERLIGNKHKRSQLLYLIGIVLSLVVAKFAPQLGTLLLGFFGAAYGQAHFFHKEAIIPLFRKAECVDKGDHYIVQKDCFEIKVNKKDIHEESEGSEDPDGRFFLLNLGYLVCQRENAEAKVDDSNSALDNG